MASSEGNIVGQLQKHTECSICISTFTDPRGLPCLHTFCLKCLEKIASSLSKSSGDEMLCPTCRTVFTVPSNGFEGLPRDFNMNSLIMLANNAMLSSTVTNDNCGEHKSKPLDAYCLDCEQPICFLCLFDIHQGHKAMDFAEVTEKFSKELTVYMNRISSYKEQSLHLMDEQDKKRKRYLKEIDDKKSAVLKRSTELIDRIKRNTKSLLEELCWLKSKHLAEMEKEREKLAKQCAIMESYQTYYEATGAKASLVDICDAKKELHFVVETLDDWFKSSKVSSFEVFLQLHDKIEIDLKSEINNVVGRIKTICKDNAMQKSMMMCYEGKMNQPRQATVKGKDNAMQKSMMMCYEGRMNQPRKATWKGKDESELTPVKKKKVMVIGSGYSWKVTNDMFEFNLHQPNEISKLQPVPTRMISKAAAVSFDDKLLLIGIGEDYNEIWKFERLSGWTKCAYLDKGRYKHCANMVETSIYICGGWNVFSGKVLKSMEKYDLQTKKCSTVGELVHAVQMSASVAYKGLIYIFGGRLEEGDVTDCVQTFSTRDNTCSLFLKPMPSPQTNLQALPFSNLVILLNHETCFTFNFKKKTWRERKHFKTDVESFGLVLDDEKVFEEKVYVFGGTKTDEWSSTDEIKCVRLGCIFKGYMVEWNLHGRLPKPSEIYAYV